MRSFRVQIGSLVVRHPSLRPADGVALGRMIETRLQQLLLQRGISQGVGSTATLRVNAPASTAVNSCEGAAHAVAQALYRGLTGKG